MLKIETDGSGVKNVIVGCPFCEEGIIMVYDISSWYINTSIEIDGSHMVGPIKYCPYCGKRLPALDGWLVVPEEDKYKGAQQ